MNTPTQDLPVSDEIDLLQLLKSALATWKHWLVALIIVSAIYGGIKAIQIAAVTQETVYSKPIRLTFPNAHKLLFPSGAKFAYSDIVAPAVIKIAYERNNIKDYEWSVSELQAALTASPYSPSYPLLMKRYGILMADKKLTADQIGELQKQMEKDIEQATSGEALISLRLVKKDLPKDVADKLLNDIPAIWAERAIKQKGVLNINVQLASANSINKELILNEDPLVAGDIIAEKLQALKTNISKLSEYEGSQSTLDPVTGMKTLDLTYAAEDMGNYLLGSLVAPVRELGLTESTQKTIYYYQDRIKKLNLQLDALKIKAQSVQTVYDSYNDSSKVANGGAGTAALSDINADVVDKLVSLSGDANRQKYRQKLHTQWIKLMGEVAALEASIKDAQLVLDAVKKSVGIQKTEEYKTYLESTKKQIPLIVDKLVGLYEVSERIYEQLSIESVGVKDQLYIPVTNTILSTRVLIDIKSTILTWIALMFLTSILVIPGVMIRNAMKSKRETN
ncbi:MAG: hypothetical protein IPK77_12930 [Cellvibrio sp.]|nr:hypothetical protein [Cellvibrio sp.]